MGSPRHRVALLLLTALAAGRGARADRLVTPVDRLQRGAVELGLGGGLENASGVVRGLVAIGAGYWPLPQAFVRASGWLVEAGSAGRDIELSAGALFGDDGWRQGAVVELSTGRSAGRPFGHGAQLAVRGLFGSGDASPHQFWFSPAILYTGGDEDWAGPSGALEVGYALHASRASVGLALGPEYLMDDRRGPSPQQWRARAFLHAEMARGLSFGASVEGQGYRVGRSWYGGAVLMAGLAGVLYPASSATNAYRRGLRSAKRVRDDVDYAVDADDEGPDEEVVAVDPLARCGSLRWVKIDARRRALRGCGMEAVFVGTCDDTGHCRYTRAARRE